MKRKYDRKEVTGVYGDMALDNSILNGIVDDISPGGFKLSQLPGSFQNDKHVYTVIISTGNCNYRILAKPVWENKETSEHGTEVGFKVIDAPWEWAEFTFS